MKSDLPKISFPSLPAPPKLGNLPPLTPSPAKEPVNVFSNVSPAPSPFKIPVFAPLPLPSPSKITVTSPPKIETETPFPSMQSLAAALPVHVDEPKPALPPIKLPALHPIVLKKTTLSPVSPAPLKSPLPSIKTKSPSKEQKKTEGQKEQKEQKEETKGIETYFTLDNGGKRFRVEIDGDDIVVSENKKGKKKFIIYEKRNVGIYDGGAGKDKGSSLLVDENDGNFVFIGTVVKRFKPFSFIVSYLSPVGNSGVPYPYAFGGNNYYYLMLHDVVLDGTKMGEEYRTDGWKTPADPYGWYYSAGLITEDISNGKKPMFDYEVQELWDENEDGEEEQLTFTFQTKYSRFKNPYIVLKDSKGEKIPLTYQKYREIREKAAENIGVVGFLRPFVIYDKDDQYYEYEGEDISPVTVDEEDDYINNKLRLAARAGNAKAIKRLVQEEGARDFDAGLSGAVEGNHMKLVEYFVEKGATDFNGGLAGAARIGNQKMVDYFIKQGADDWEYAMASAAAGGQERFVDFFHGNYGAKDVQRAAQAAAKQKRAQLAAYILTL